MHSPNCVVDWSTRFAFNNLGYTVQRQTAQQGKLGTVKVLLANL